MINTAELNQAMQQSGLKKSAVAGRLQLTTQTLTRKLNGESEFNISEAQELSEMLGLSASQRQRIFFGN
jgi:ribosome-binding protein aMBF1 (putative translation factor)